MEVRVQCKSRIPTPFSLEGCISTEYLRQGISITPDNAILLKPKETRVFTVNYRPLERTRPQTFTINALVLGKEQPFITVTGACQGADVSLDCKTVTFGSVVVGTRVVRRLTILNTGDVTLDFNWNEKKLGKDFSVVPPSGVAQAHSEVKCDLIYQPLEICKDAKRDLELRFNEAPPVYLGITSTNCVERPPLTDVLNFQCRVRESTVQRITIKNDSMENWTLRPTISNPVWNVPDTIVVRSRDVAECPITYSPLVLTKNRAEGNDSGSLFIGLPTGNALLYRLDGVSDPPALAAPPLERDVVAKTTHVEKLTVSNWLSVPQKFVVTQQWAHDAKDESINIKGVPTIDVPANSTREYKLNFSSYKEGIFKGSVTFVNDESKEYQYYNLQFSVKPAKDSSTIEMRTPARQRLVKTVTISNPLAKAVTLVSKADNPELIVPPTIVAAPKSETKVNIEFFPLIVKEYPPSKLVFSSAELGEFPHTVSLIGTPALQEKPTRLTCALGQAVSATLRFQCFSKTATEFAFKLSDPKQSAFFKSSGSGGVKVNACADLKVGQEVSVDVTFEPSRVGEYKETVELVSAAGGSYVFPLMGVCTSPQRPQGPIDIKPNGTAQISFKNVFNENVQFSFVSEDPRFVLSKTSEVLPSKKSTTITVTYKCDDNAVSANGKLTISGVLTSIVNAALAANAAASLPMLVQDETNTKGNKKDKEAAAAAAAAAMIPAPISAELAAITAQATHTWIYYLRGMKESDVVAQQAASPPAQASASAAKKGK
eukprot:GILK01005063.1.p1 GENE.GILK01005063.1~~GILK01005063.1.p1  ORF type:complete len:857 (-),score=69.85 GILK01005063.1:123-2435(-)